MSLRQTGGLSTDTTEGQLRLREPNPAFNRIWRVPKRFQEFQKKMKNLKYN